MIKKTVVVFAGANGSGKSTLIANNWKLSPGPYYICPDNLLNPEIPNERDRYIDAMNRAEQLRYEAVKAGKSFVFETVFSTQGKLDFLKECKRNGYFVSVIYVATSDPNINIKRVEDRVKQGGHDVPTKDVVSRYYRSLGFLKDIIKVADSVEVYDNSFEEPFRVFLKFKDTMVLFNKERLKEWVHEYIEKHFYSDIDFVLSERATKNFYDKEESEQQKKSLFTRFTNFVLRKK